MSEKTKLDIDRMLSELEALQVNQQQEKNKLFSTFGISEIVDKIYSKGVDWAEKYGIEIPTEAVYKGTKPTKEELLTIELNKYPSTVGISTRQMIKKMFEIALDIELGAIDSHKSQKSGKVISGFVQWVAIVPLRNPNSHNYPIGEVSLSTNNSDYGSNALLRVDGTYGNSMDRYVSSFRMASKEEISDFLIKLVSNNEREFINLLKNIK